MQNTRTLQQLNSADLEANPTFNVVIAYEDFETGKHAKRTYDFLAEHLGHDCHFFNQMWKFDVLAIPKLCQMAAQDAAKADIIIVSSHGTGGLPAEVKAWVDSWLAQKTNAVALVALFDCPREETRQNNPVRTYLANVAKRAGMEFFAQPDNWPGRKSAVGRLSFQHNAELSEKTFSTLAGAVQQEVSVSRWGLNE